VLLKKLIIFYIEKRFSVFYAILDFIILFTTSPVVPILSQFNSVHI